MAVYMEEEEIWKCPKHPSKRRRNGICHVCLRDRLISLCPDCANIRPCSCCPATTSSSSSSSSSSFYFFTSGGGVGGSGGRVSDLIDGEPSFRRSRSVGIPFLFTRFAKQQKECDQWKNTTPPPPLPPCHSKTKTATIWTKLKKFNKSSKKRQEEIEEKENQQPKENFRNDSDSSDESVCRNSNTSIEEFSRMMMKSRSVHVSMMTGDGRSSTGKGKGWSFSSPMKVFRHSSKATPKVVQDRSPLYRG